MSRDSLYECVGRYLDNALDLPVHTAAPLLVRAKRLEHQLATSEARSLKRRDIIRTQYGVRAALRRVSRGAEEATERVLALEAAANAMREYAHHLPSCPAPGGLCDCGYITAIMRLRELLHGSKT